MVGAGSSGAVIANRLSEDPGVTVLLIEAGGSELDNDNFRVPLFAPASQKTKADWGYYTVPQKNSMFGMNEQKNYWPSGRVLGGSSNLNYMTYIRGHKEDYNQWAKEGCTGWAYKDVLPYFLKSEDIQVITKLPNLNGQSHESIEKDNTKQSHRKMEDRNGPDLVQAFQTKWWVEPGFMAPNLPLPLRSKDPVMTKTQHAYHSEGGPLTISPYIATDLLEVLTNAAEELGYKPIDANGEDQLEFSYVQNTVRNGERCSTATAYLRTAMDRPNLDIGINSFATKVIIEEMQAKGVEVIKHNRKIKFYANKEVILSAGGIRSPALLMLSGVGPKEHLQTLGIPVHADLPVGNNLQNHMLTNLVYNLNASLSITSQDLLKILPKLQYKLTGTGIYSGFGAEAQFFGQIAERDPNEPNYPDYQNIFVSVAQDKEMIDNGPDVNYKSSVTEMLKTRARGTEVTAACFMLHPKSRGTIRLSSADPFDPPLLDPNYLDHPYDIKVSLAAVRKHQEFMNTKTFQKYGAMLTRYDMPGFCDTIPFDTDQYWECIIRHFSSTGFHPSGSCRMGSLTDSTAVVDPELRVKGIKGLRVADTSVMRLVTSGGTNAPAIMIGEKVADLIRGKDTVALYRQKI